MAFKRKFQVGQRVRYRKEGNWFNMPWKSGKIILYERWVGSKAPYQIQLDGGSHGPSSTRWAQAKELKLLECPTMILKRMLKKK